MIESSAAADGASPGDASPLPDDVPPRPGMEQRSAVLLIAGFATVLLAAALAFIPVPYAVFGPGPVINTLGEVKGRRLISVTGRQAYPTTGTLDMTTVRVFGGPGTRISLLSVLTAWISDKRAAVPEEAVFPPGQSQQQTQENDRLLMVSSQESATAAALGALGIPVPTKLTIFGVSPDVPAADVLKPQDVLVEVGDTRIQDLTQLRALLQKVEPGEEVRLTVRRGNAEQELVTRTTRGEDGQTLLGVFLDPKFTFPFAVKIDIPDVSGPSAGMVFALGIIDTLTPGDLTGGKQIAGTGTIDADGKVGPIGGIPLKMVAARDIGAELFLVPAGNCEEAAAAPDPGFPLARVANLDDALKALADFEAGRTPATC